MRTMSAFLLTAVFLAATPSVPGGPILDSLQEEIRAVVDAASPAVVSVRTDPHPLHPFAGLPENEVPGWVRCLVDNRLAEPRCASGSGFFIDSSGLVLTTENVVRGAGSIEVVLADGRVLPARVLGGDQDFNVALLQVEGEEDFPCLELGDSSEVRPGSWAIGVGNPFGLAGSISWGLISGVRRNGLGTALYEDLIQVTAPINPGDSGGPLLDSHGEVIGVITAALSGYRETEVDWPFLRGLHSRYPAMKPVALFRASQAQGIGFAIPISLAREVVDRIRENPRSQRGWIGVRLGDLTSWARFRHNLPPGALVLDVLAGSPAARAGLLPEDIIISYQGNRVTDCFQLKKELLFTSVGEEVSLGVFRGGEPLEFRLVTVAPALGAPGKELEGGKE